MKCLISTETILAYKCRVNDCSNVQAHEVYGQDIDGDDNSRLMHDGDRERVHCDNMTMKRHILRSTFSLFLENKQQQLLP